jgi:hypothetical protein
MCHSVVHSPHCSGSPGTGRRRARRSRPGACRTPAGWSRYGTSAGATRLARSVHDLQRGHQERRGGRVDFGEAQREDRVGLRVEFGGRRQAQPVEQLRERRIDEPGAFDAIEQLVQHGSPLRIAFAVERRHERHRMLLRACDRLGRRQRQVQRLQRRVLRVGHGRHQPQIAADRVQVGELAQPRGARRNTEPRSGRRKRGMAE